MPPIRFVNLDRAGERRAFMERQGERLGLAFERVRALEPADIDRAEIERLAATWQRQMTHGEVACFLSHRLEWARVAEEDGPALILEDDAVLAPRVAAILEAAAHLREVELLNLESYGRRRFLRDGDLLDLGAGVRGVRCLRDKAGAAAYLLWPEGARRLLAATEGRAGLADAVLHGARLRAYVCEPAMAAQLSTLEAMGGRGEIDGASLLQAPRSPGRPTTRQRLRRARAQIGLVPMHLLRLAGTSYRSVHLDPETFSAGPPEPRDARTPR